MRVVDETGQQAGVLPLNDAINLAKSKGLDLILVTESAVPPVCRIGDYGKYKYELEKKKKIAKKKQKTIETKEIRIRPQIGEHDLLVKLNYIRRFLAEGDKVKISIVFKGREIAYQELGRKLLARIIEDLKELSVMEQQPKRDGMSMIMVLAPLSK